MVGVILFFKDIFNLLILLVEIVECEYNCCNGLIEVEMNIKVGGGDVKLEGLELFF